MKRYAKLVPLVRNPAAVKSLRDLNLDEAGKALAKSLDQGRDEGSFEVHMVDDKTGAPWRLDMRGGKSAVSKEAAGKAHFAIKASRATLAEMAKGDLSPVDAYLAGRLEVHGDLDFGMRLFARLAARGGDKEL
jgi:putative sterol carrier protein